MVEKYKLAQPVIRIDTPEVANGDYLLARKSDARLMDPKLAIISEGYYRAFEEQNRNLPDNEHYTLPEDVSVGDIIVKHPFLPRHYVLIEELERRAKEDLLGCMEEIAGKLGCLKMSWTVEYRTSQKRTWDSNNGMSYEPVAKVNVDFSKEETASKNNSISTETTWTGYEGKTAEEIQKLYKEAKKKATECGLRDNPYVKSLLIGRNPAAGSLTKTKTVTITISDHINRYINAAFSLNAMRDVFTLNASVKHATEYCKEIVVSYHMSFVKDTDDTITPPEFNNPQNI